MAHAPPIDSYVARCHRYARDVVTEKIAACRWVRYACQRHLDGLEDADSLYRFDDELAIRACKFIELLPHTKGAWARPVPGHSNRIRLEDWQVFIVCSIFGWVEVATGLRKYAEVLLVIPRKNAKSTLAAAIGLYMMVADGEYGAEIYSGATTEKQAWEVFRVAWRMAKKTPELKSYFGVEIAAKSLYREDDGSRFEPIVGDPGDGASPSCAIGDEFHEHPNANLHDTMKTGMGARSQPLMLNITTAGSNIAGPCYDLQLHLQKVLEGLVEDDAFFGIIYTIDENDDWTTIEAQIKANPNYGVSVLAPFLAKQLHDAKTQAAKQNIYKTKHLNIWCGAAVAWMNQQAWNACADPGLKREDFAGHEAWLGNDLSAKIDMTASVIAFLRMIPHPQTGVPQRHYYVFGRYYLPLDRTMAEGCQHYQKWAHEGRLTTIPGAEIQFGLIRRDILADTENHHVRIAAFDPWGATQLQQELAAELPKDTIITIPQQTRFMTESMKEIEAAVIAGRLHHDGDPVLAWSISNVVARIDAKGDLFPTKERAQNKIDGALALIMAISRAMVAMPKKKSVYSSRGLLAV